MSKVMILFGILAPILESTHLLTSISNLVPTDTVYALPSEAGRSNKANASQEYVSLTYL
jgi:hypothetical protein